MDEEFEVEDNAIVISADVENTVAYSLIAEAEKLNQVLSILVKNSLVTYLL